MENTANPCIHIQPTSISMTPSVPRKRAEFFYVPAIPCVMLVKVLLAAAPDGIYAPQFPHLHISQLLKYEKCKISEGNKRRTQLETLIKCRRYAFECS